MQLNHDGTRYAECQVKDATGFTISLIEPSKGKFMVGMWRPDGDNHWVKDYKDFNAALGEYNRWADVPEEVTA